MARLGGVGFPRAGIENAVHSILATKDHIVAMEGFVACFLDVGLSRK
jgi:hypothetical protein